MSEIESLVNSLRGMELPKGAESLLSTILGKSNTLESDKDSLKKALDKREGENKTARDAIKTLETERDDLKTKLPGDGSRVLPKAEAERYDAYTALNLKPDEIKTQLEQASQDRQAVLTASNLVAVKDSRCAAFTSLWMGSLAWPPWMSEPQTCRR